MADFAIEKKVYGTPGKDWVPAFGMTKMSLPVARSEEEAIKIFEKSVGCIPVARLVTWDGRGVSARKRVVAAKGVTQ